MRYHSARVHSMTKVMGRQLAITAELISTHPFLLDLADAKRRGDDQEIARLMPMLLSIFGRGPHTLRLYRSL
jgi:hypothetical protein